MSDQLKLELDSYDARFILEASRGILRALQKRAIVQRIEQRRVLTFSDKWWGFFIAT